MNIRLLISCLLVAATGFLRAEKAHESKFDPAKIEAITGLKGKFSEKEGVFKITAPRSDMKIVVDGCFMDTMTPKRLNRLFSSSLMEAKAAHPRTR